MSSGIGIRPSVLEARQRWRDGRANIRKLHDNGGFGLDVCRELSDLLDSILLEIYQNALADISPNLESRIAITLLGGCGRQDIAPYSDVDLMLLYQGSLTDDVVEFSRRIAQDITDAGMQLGYSLRTPREACTMSLSDAYIFSSLTEARRLAGNEDLFQHFQGRFRRMTTKKVSNLIKAIVAAREKERAEFGETVYMLRPNVKRSRGGLRDIHLIRWLGFVQYAETDIDRMLTKSAISTADSTQLNQSREFLLRVRNEMHFHADRANDMLGRNEQVRLADRFGYAGDDALLSVEEFMRQYFRFTSRIRYVCDHFVSKSLRRRKVKQGSIIEPLMTRQIDHHFRMGPTYIGVANDSLEEVKSELEQVLRLMQLACLHGKKIEHDTWISIRHEMLKYPLKKFTRDCARRFMALLSNTQGLGPLLRRLHEMKVLQIILPGFEHARGLLQFNEYHKFTVDEHSLQAVENAIAYEFDQSIVGKTYRSIREKNLLHLALLLHDLGKGFPEDHSEVGRRMAQDTGNRFDLTDEETETIMFLVHNHLVMSHLAFHRDINDQTMVAEFAANVGSVQTLSMLYVLTCADIAAVGPDVLTPWKQNLLENLFLNARDLLTGDLSDDVDQRFQPYYEKVADVGTGDEEQTWLKQKAQSLPRNYCRSHPPEQVAEQLLELKKIETEGIICWVRQVPDSDLMEIVVGKSSGRRTGVFYKVCGTLSSLGIQIQAADIKPLGDSAMWYWIQFEDTSYRGTPPEHRLDEIRQKVKAQVLGTDDSPPRFRSVWKRKDSVADKLSRPKIEVKIDNQTVNSATIIDVFAFDKVGLLYKLAKKIHRLGLDVTYARVTIYAKQVIGVFYVTDENGAKIRNRNQIQIIKREIKRAAIEFLLPSESQS
ncbi:MAG: [protein-PII] uridylyltransferase [Planctomycetota bacterium]